MHYRKIKEEEVGDISNERAELYLKRMYQRIVSGWGGCQIAVDEVADRCGMTRSQVKHILEGRSKDVGLTSFGKIRAAYLQFLKDEKAAIDAEILREDERTERMNVVFFDEEIDQLRKRLTAIKGGAAA